MRKYIRVKKKISCRSCDRSCDCSGAYGWILDKPLHKSRENNEFEVGKIPVMFCEMFGSKRRGWCWLKRSEVEVLTVNRLNFLTLTLGKGITPGQAD